MCDLDETKSSGTVEDEILNEDFISFCPISHFQLSLMIPTTSLSQAIGESDFLWFLVIVLSPQSLNH